VTAIPSPTPSRPIPAAVSTRRRGRTSCRGGGIGGMAQCEVGSRETSLEARTPGALEEAADRRGVPNTGPAIAPITAANIILRLSIAVSFWTPLSAPLLPGFLRVGHRSSRLHTRVHPLTAVLWSLRHCSPHVTAGDVVVAGRGNAQPPPGAGRSNEPTVVYGNGDGELGRTVRMAAAGPCGCRYSMLYRHCSLRLAAQ
jgi:hypothetical protein